MDILTVNYHFRPLSLQLKKAQLGREKFAASRGIKMVFQAEDTKTLQYNPAMEHFLKKY